MFPSILEAAAPLAVCALGALMAFRAGHFTLGGEGQLCAGGSPPRRPERRRLQVFRLARLWPPAWAACLAAAPSAAGKR